MIPLKHSAATDERIRRAYENCEVIADVAHELGFTRNMVIGRARRLGLCSNGRNATLKWLRAGEAQRAAILDALNGRTA